MFKPVAARLKNGSTRRHLPWYNGLTVIRHYYTRNLPDNPPAQLSLLRSPGADARDIMIYFWRMYTCHPCSYQVQSM